WIRAAPRLVRELAAVRVDLDYGSPVLEQLVAVELFGRWEETLATRRELLRPRRDALLQALPPGWTARRPHGGLAAWVRLPAPVARGRRLIAPGPSFWVEGTFERHIRLPYCAPPEQLTDAVASLAEMATRLGAPAAEPLATAV